MPLDEDDLDLARKLLGAASPELLDVGRQWYVSAHGLCRQWAADTGKPVEQVAAIVALYSINQSWGGNVTLARQALYDGRCVGMGNVVWRVKAILDGNEIEPLLAGMPKVRSFYRNLLLQDAVTIDRWMCRLFGKDKPDKWYAYCERCVRCLALEWGWPAYDMQATLWLLTLAHLGRSVGPRMVRGVL
jgi:hypothetical protein